MFSSTVSTAQSSNADTQRNNADSRTTSGQTTAPGATSPASTVTPATLEYRPGATTDDHRPTAISYKDLDYASQQKIMRAIHVLGNSGLLMKYALENDVSIPQARHYFEQVAGGGDPKPIINKWFPF